MPRVASGERRFIEESVRENVRVDGRSALDSRHLVVQTQVADFCNGSALIERVGTHGAVMAATKVDTVDISTTQDRTARMFFDVTVDVTSLEAVDDEGLSRKWKDMSRDLADMVEKQLEQMIAAGRARLLEVVPDSVAWSISVDLVVLGYDGNLQDLCSLAVYMAINDTKVPRTEITASDEGQDFDLEPDLSQAVGLNAELLAALPIRVTLFQISGLMIADASEQEEEVSSCALSVLVNRKGELCGTHIAKSGRLPLSALAGYLSSTCQIGAEVFKLIDSDQRH